VKLASRHKIAEVVEEPLGFSFCPVWCWNVFVRSHNLGIIGQTLFEKSYPFTKLKIYGQAVVLK